MSVSVIRNRLHFSDEEVFGRQPSKTSELPDSEPLIRNLARCVVEILSGVRDLEQISRWLDYNVYLTLRHRVIQIEHLRQTQQKNITRPVFTIGAVLICEPGDGIVEATVIVHSPFRSRAVAIRLEGFDHRWYATSITIL